MPAFGSGNERHIDKKYPALEKQSLISNPRKNRTYAPIIRHVAYRCESRHAVDTAAHVVETGASPAPFAPATRDGRAGTREASRRERPNRRGANAPACDAAAGIRGAGQTTARSRP
ncbi:hypothetical protein AQ611_13185 [Burkholderia singularis]|nr:hypothetical protein AQ611_13185 [Burkholderia sp. Bp7605]